MNILATDRLDEILAANGVRGQLCPRTMAEAVYLNPRVSGDPRDAIDLTPHIASGILVRSSLSEEEIASYVRFAAEVDDGEAQVLAVGLHRRLLVGTDDRRARRVATREGVELVSTPELILQWARGGTPSAAEQRSAIVDIEVRARYRPRPSDPSRAERDPATPPAPEPDRDHLGSALAELDNIRWDDIWERVEAVDAEEDDDLAKWSRKYVSYVRDELLAAIGDDNRRRVATPQPPQDLMTVEQRLEWWERQAYAQAARAERAEDAPHLHPNYDCGGKGHRSDVSEVQWCHDCTPHLATPPAPTLPPCPICGKNDLFIGRDGKPGCPHCEVAVVLPPTPPAPEPCEICGKPGHSVDACPAAEWGTLTPPAQPLPTVERDERFITAVLDYFLPFIETPFAGQAAQERIDERMRAARFLSRLSEARDE